jgi:hypothetical protein
MVGDIQQALGTLQSAMSQGGAPPEIQQQLDAVLQGYQQFVQSVTGQGGGQESAQQGMNTPEQGPGGGSQPF